MAAATTAASSATVRYAPEDPSLPKPWRGLVDGKTGFLYFWNPETNVTQYERPYASSSTSSAPSNNASGSSYQNVRKSHDEGRYSNDGSAKLAADPGTNQSARNQSNCALSGPDVMKNAVQKPIDSKVSETGLSVEEYCRRHEITVTGGNVPKPFTSFQATGFPPEILREVRYLLQTGAKCRTLCHLPFGTCLLFECLVVPSIHLKGFLIHWILPSW